MYESFYNFNEKPFSLLPDPEFLYLGERHKEALSMLEYGMMHRAGIILITGEIGCGKTTLIRHLIQNQDMDIIVGNITNTHKSFGELLKWVMLSFGLEYRDKDKVELYQDLVEFLHKKYRQGKRVALIVDEAQNMTPDALEEMRMLSNINVDKEQVLQIILVGQPELRENLKLPELRQLAQRVAVDYYLEPLDPKEAFEYIRHRIQVAGGNPDIISLDAFKEIYLSSGGTPRLMNTICDTSLVYGYAEQASVVTGEIVKEVVRDKSKGNILPLEYSKKDMEERSQGTKHVRIGS
jgi:putative secretion ATPase (PEP-CTERM system associated)